MATTSKLARKSVGGGALWFFSVGASAPLTVLISVVTTFARTGVVGVPLSFLLLGGGLSLMTVGFVYMASYVRHPALFYALAAVGLNPAIGVASGVMSVLFYVSIHLSLYGLFGATVSAVLGGDWVVWALLTLVVIAVLGQVRVDINARFFAWTLVAEIVVVVLFIIVAFTRPAGGTITFSPLSAATLFTDRVGKAFALGVAAFIGWETGAAAYGEEARTRQAVIRATFGALGFVTVLYTLAAWAIPVVVGPAWVAEAAKRDPELPLTVLSGQFGLIVLVFATMLLWSSILAAMLSFHNTATRNVFGMAREGVLPGVLARVGSGVADGAPTRASWLISGLSLTVLLGVRAFGIAPLTMFAWLAAGSAVGILTSLLVTQAASYQFFRRGGGTHEGRWVRQIAPIAGAVVGAAILMVTVANLSSLLGVDDDSRRPWLIPGAVALIAVLGLLYGVMLRWSRPGLYTAVGHGQPDPQAPEQRLSGLDL